MKKHFRADNETRKEVRAEFAQSCVIKKFRFRFEQLSARVPNRERQGSTRISSHIYGNIDSTCKQRERKCEIIMFLREV